MGKKRVALRDRIDSAERNEPGKRWSKQTEMLGLVKVGLRRTAFGILLSAP